MMNPGTFKQGGLTRDIERLAVKVNKLKADSEEELLRLQHEQYKAAGGTWGFSRWLIMGKPDKASRYEL